MSSSGVKIGVVSVVALTMFVAQPARAELRELAGRVGDAYRAAGGHVETLQPRFLYEDETVVLALPVANGARCTTLAIIGARGLSFHVAESDDDTRRDEEGHVYSVAGALEIDSCDVRAANAIRVRSDAGRGAIEIIVAHSQAAMPSLRTILPERVGGALPPSVDPGPLPSLPPPEKRADAAESVARRDGATISPRAMAAATADGVGTVHVHLERACHRIELFSPEAFAGRRKARLDLGEAADARLDVCVGEPRDVLLSFGGALPGAPIIIARASWPLPASLPAVWNADANRRLAGALRARHVTPPRAPIALYEGVIGATSLVTHVEPGACYVAVVAATRGVPRGVVLRVAVGASEHADERGTGDGAAIVSFCTADRDRVRMTVEARGSALAWGLALYRMTSGNWEAAP